jgi:hypothetical protein
MAYAALDYVYQPSRDVASDLAFLRDVRGARVVFAIEAMGTRVAMVELSPAPPYLLLADHLDGERPILVYRVDDLAAEIHRLEERHQVRERRLEIPRGPVRVCRGPGGHLYALYQLVRPDFLEHFEGRIDF